MKYTLTTSALQDVALGIYLAEQNARAKADWNRLARQWELLGPQSGVLPDPPVPLTAQDWLQAGQDSRLDQLNQQYLDKTTALLVQSFAVKDEATRGKVLDLMKLGFLKGATVEQIVSIALPLAPAIYLAMSPADQDALIGLLA